MGRGCWGLSLVLRWLTGRIWVKEDMGRVGGIVYS